MLCTNNNTLAFLSEFQFHAMSAWFFVSGITCILCNFQIAKVFYSNESLKSDHNLIVALAISDTFAGVSGIERSATALYPLCSLSMFQCALHEIPMQAYASSNYLIVLALSVLRLLGMEYPMKCKRLIEKKFHLWFYAGVVLYSLALCVISVFNTWDKTEKLNICTMSSLPQVKFYTYLALLCLVLICAANVRLYVIMRRKNNQPIDNPAAVKAARMSKTLIIISVAFVLSTASSAVIYAIATSLLEVEKGTEVTFSISGVATMTGSFVNFFIYWFRLPEFRRSIVKDNSVVPVSINGAQSAKSGKEKA